MYILLEFSARLKEPARHLSNMDTFHLLSWLPVVAHAFQLAVLWSEARVIGSVASASSPEILVLQCKNGFNN
ncbi:hypothetical protein GWI33_018923 [Rhynchophorus ferrugineus]|uniref:Uncharacterized protein n=1 Tax=Rhynchophorus ferrugineus TaxID=354439 RepID=A0A834M5S5_RHYFE|nr:hypothetical protein GWI33_018923 [Rhynchophorus ferrugineus]